VNLRIYRGGRRPGRVAGRGPLPHPPPSRAAEADRTGVARAGHARRQERGEGGLL